MKGQPQPQSQEIFGDPMEPDTDADSSITIKSASANVKLFGYRGAQA
jgi:hypothetical protein